jgi:hypothetical protein
LFEGLDVRIDCTSGYFFGNGDMGVYISICVVRKSDGLIAMLVPRTALHSAGGMVFGPREHYEPPARRDRHFAANPTLRGLLPFISCDLPTRLSTSLNFIRGGTGTVGAIINVGTNSEFPWSGMRFAGEDRDIIFDSTPDASVIVGDDGFVTLRKLSVAFAAPDYVPDQWDDWEEASGLVPYPAGPSTRELRHLLASQLQFA